MSATALTLRLASPSDAPTLALMSRDLIERGLEWRYGVRRVCLLIQDPNTTTLVACERDRVAGFGMMEFGDEVAHLVLFAVQPSYQRRGVGRRMLEWLVQSAQTAGIASIHLELRSGNRAARAFYRAMGFAETFLVHNYYGGRESALRMLRLLRRPTPTTFVWRPPV